MVFSSNESKSTVILLVLGGTSILMVLMSSGSRVQGRVTSPEWTRIIARFWMGPVGPCSPGIQRGYASARGPGCTRISSCTKVMRRKAWVSSTSSVIVGTGVFCAITTPLVIEKRSSSPTAGVLERIGMILQIFQRGAQAADFNKSDCRGLRPSFSAPVRPTAGGAGLANLGHQPV